MAARQLLHRRRADAGNPRRSAARASTASCPSSPTGRSGAIRASSASRGPSSRTPTAGSIPRRCARFVQRLPAGAAAHHRRTLGGRDHAAHRAGRESAASGGADRSLAGARAARPTRSPTSCSASAAARPTRRRRRCPALDAARCGRGIRRAARASASPRPGSRRSRRRCLAGRAPGGAGTRRPTRSCAGEHQRQAAMTVTVRNVITSMRLMSALDWADVLRERQSGRRGAARGQRFRGDGLHQPGRYRHAIEELARGSERTELDVARMRCCRRTRAAASDAATGRSPADRIQAFTSLAERPRDFERADRVSIRAVDCRLLRAYHRRGLRSGISEHWSSSRRRSWRCRSCRVGGPHAGCRAVGARRPRFYPGIRSGDRPPQPRRDHGHAPVLLPRLELPAGVPADLPDDGRGADAARRRRPTSSEQIERLEVHYLANRGRRCPVRAGVRLAGRGADCMPADDDDPGAAARAGIAATERTARHRRRTAAPASSSSIAGACGMRARASGWAGSASGASCTS